MDKTLKIWTNFCNPPDIYLFKDLYSIISSYTFTPFCHKIFVTRYFITKQMIKYLMLVIIVKYRNKSIQNPDKFLRWSVLQKIFNSLYLLTIFAKRSILGVWQGSEALSWKIRLSFVNLHKLYNKRMIECETIFHSSIYLKLANWKFTKANNWRKQSFGSRSRYSTKVLLELHKIYEKRSAGISFITGSLETCNFLRYRQRYFRMNFEKFSRTIFSKNTSRRLLQNCLLVLLLSQNCANVLSIWKVLYFVIASNSRFYTVELNRRAK